VTEAESAAFVKRAKNSRVIGKRDFVSRHVAGKDVLDLGFVAHSLESCLQNPEAWLHGVIRKHARRVLGVDLLEQEVAKLREMGYEAIHDNALTVRLESKFDVVVCGDLIEHVANPAALLATIEYHLAPDGVALVTTPNPFAAARFFNILADGQTAVNVEHTCWFCPQTFYQLLLSSGLEVRDFYWLETDFPMPTHHRLFGGALDWASRFLARRNHLFGTDFGVVLSKRGEGD